MARIHSFDVFDTSLIRKVAAPSDVFRLVASRIAAKSGLSDQSSFVEDFVAARVRAEEEVSFSDDRSALDEIWERLHELLPQLPPHFGSREELNAEQSLLVPNAIVAQRIARLRSEGHRIVFASDTNFSEEFVREQLLRNGVAHVDDRVYVSSGRQHTKSTGELFKTILAREGIKAAELHHYGDNAHSDFKVPRRLGISATLLTDTYLNAWERGVLSKDINHRMAMASLAGSMRAFRLSNAEKLTSADELVATFLGPLLTVWAAWVLGAAQRDGIRRLYFVSRDAYLLCKAARALAPRFGDIECRDLRLSRQTTQLPSADQISPSGMKWLGSGSIRRLGAIVDRLALKWSDVAEHFSSLVENHDESKFLTSNEEWSAFWNIVRSSPIVDIVRENIETKKADLLAYLRCEGLCEDVPAALVDLGWRASAQACLRKVLGHTRHDGTLSGYYLGLGPNRIAPAAAGRTTALFYQEAADHTSISPRYEVFRRIDILENIVGLAPFGSVRAYQRTDAGVMPICDTASALHVEFVARIDESLERYFRTDNDVSASYADISTAREAINSLVATWSARPSKSVLGALAHIVVVDGMRSDSEPLLLHWRVADAAKTLIPSRWHEGLRISRRISVWPEAATSTLSARFILMLSAMARTLTGRRFDWRPLPRWDKPN